MIVEKLLLSGFDIADSFSGMVLLLPLSVQSVPEAFSTKPSSPGWKELQGDASSKRLKSKGDGQRGHKS